MTPVVAAVICRLMCLPFQHIDVITGSAAHTSMNTSVVQIVYKFGSLLDSCKNVEKVNIKNIPNINNKYTYSIYHT